MAVPRWFTCRKASCVTPDPICVIVESASMPSNVNGSYAVRQSLFSSRFAASFPCSRNPSPRLEHLSIRPAPLLFIRFLFVLRRPLNPQTEPPALSLMTAVHDQGVPRANHGETRVRNTQLRRVPELSVGNAYGRTNSAVRECASRCRSLPAV